MKINRIIYGIAMVVLGAFSLAACSNGSSEQVDAHMEAEEHVETPHEYEELKNPYEGDHEVAEAGAEIYQANCETCHGTEGKGDGPAAAGLDPQPADLTDTHMMEEMSDGALFWRVSEGGMMEPFNSVMPAWKGTLTDDQIWQVVTYIQEFVEEDHDQG